VLWTGANSDLVIELLQDLNREGLTVLVVTHDEEIAQAMPRRLRLDDGVVTQDTV